MSVNRVIILGNLGKDPMLAENSSDVSICKFTVATSERKKIKGEVKKITTWHNMVCFGKTADFVVEYFKKGNLIYIEGSIDNYSFDKKDGSGKAYGSQILVDKVSFVGAKDSKNDDKTDNLPEPPEKPELPMSTQKQEEDDSLPF